MKLNYKTSSYTFKRQVKKKNDGEEVTFIKHVSVHPRDRLKKKRKGELVNYNELSKRIKMMMLLD